jgi:hypothetical protein
MRAADSKQPTNITYDPEYACAYMLHMRGLWNEKSAIIQELIEIVPARDRKIRRVPAMGIAG